MNKDKEVLEEKKGKSKRDDQRILNNISSFLSKPMSSVSKSEKTKDDANDKILESIKQVFSKKENSIEKEIVDKIEKLVVK